ncbi:TetR family transcriptional regulator [Streptomyces sp. WAC 06738]|uniref:TetR/AcrR family transcriptional regulator n=1 Tax=Streptomyces sp. WAC 06738 TaxID=2203210 RepID=UPI000F6D9C5E|nr:TetR/AcrR family transcriptional regulator [Streptomyces sp. WAC 06738]AZM49962.1 TetR family transcriptional regulator [Streptomyces sp. WAC 06738]
MSTPRSTATRTRLLDAAERLFAEHGFAATSLRTVTDAAEANVAAVNYHFGSKEGLLRAVVERAMAAVNGERRRLLGELRAAADPPGAADLVRAFVTTGAHVGDAGAGGADLRRFLGRVVCEPDPAIRRLFGAEVAPVEGEYLDALTTALPHLTPAEVAYRYRAMVGLLALHQSGTLTDFHPGPPPADPRGQDDVERLTTFLTAAFEAPASDVPSGTVKGVK